MPTLKESEKFKEKCIKTVDTSPKNNKHTATQNAHSAATDLNSVQMNTKSYTKNELKNNKCLTYFHHNNVNCVRCKVCCEFPDIVKLNSLNRKPAPITTKSGTKFLSKVVQDHLNSNAHAECYIAYQQLTLSPAEILQKTPIGRSITDANLSLANYIGKLLIYVYGGVKKLTLSGNTFPARVATGNFAENFDFQTFDVAKKEQNFQYTTPSSYREFLKIIVDCHRSDLKKILADALAVSLRSDGSVDRVQIDKIYTMVRVISKSGFEELFFLGAAEPQEKGAEGLLNAVKSGCKTTLGSDVSFLMKNISSVVTDGASINVGLKSGFWKIFNDYIKSLNTDDASKATRALPLLKIWCSVHR